MNTSFFKRVLLVLLGAVLMALNINIFVRSANLFPGGFSGVALLLQQSFEQFFAIHLPYSALVYPFNIIPVWIGFKFIGKKFTALSVLMILVSGLLTDLTAGLSFLNITTDPLLCCVFGGILNAVSVACCLFADSSSGGTDFIAIFISERTGNSAWNYIFAFNCFLLVVAGLLFGWDKALYSIIFQYASTQALNLIYRRYEKITLFIITDKPDEVFEIILMLTNHTATVFEGKGEYSGAAHKMLYSVVSAGECAGLEKAIRSKDPNAFINVIKSKEILGRFFRRMPD